MLVYCSFASDEFLGALVLESPTDDPIMVSMLAHARGLNPGGELLCIAVPEELVALYAPHQGRLLTKAEVMALFNAKSLREHEAEERSRAN